MASPIHLLDLFGTAVFAITGALAAGRKRMDLFGVAVLAAVTALGGGTLRDMILDTGPVFWVRDPGYLLIAVIAGIGTFFAVRFFDLPGTLLLVADAVGLAVFTVVGAEKALVAGGSGSIAVVMGVMTGVVGGMIRDVLAGEIPLILRKEIYATASLCGGIVFTLLFLATRHKDAAVLASLAVTLGMRLSAIRWQVSLPVFGARRGKGPADRSRERDSEDARDGEG